jgi:hypothetical protein
MGHGRPSPGAEFLYTQPCSCERPRGVRVSLRRLAIPALQRRIPNSPSMAPVREATQLVREPAAERRR